MELYLHFGTEKTGSSYLQTLLALNRDQLRKAGICYPEANNWEERQMASGKISAGNGRDLYLALQKGDANAVKALLGSFKEEAENQACRILLISNENLIEVFSDKEAFATFLALCKEKGLVPARMLMVLRDPVDQALSLYKHRAKNGEVDPIGEWIAKGYRLAEDLRRFLEVRKGYDIRFTLRKYRKDPAFMKSLLFEDWLGIAPAEKDFKAPVNPSLSLSELMLLKNVAQAHKGLVDPLYERLLAVSRKEKASDFRIENHYRAVIARYLAQFNPTFEEYSKLLPAGEELSLPEASAANLEEGVEELCFSKKQAEVLAHFMVESGSLLMKLQVLGQTAKRRLGRMKNSILH